LRGARFAGDSGNPAQVAVTARFTHPRLEKPIVLTVPPGSRTPFEVRIGFPTDADKHPAGLYSFALQIAPLAEPLDARTSDELPLAVAPRILKIGANTLPGPGQPPLILTRKNIQDGLGDITIKLTCSPTILPEQRVALVLGDREFPAAAHTEDTRELSFELRRVPAGIFRLRLRVDGVDSLLVDRSGDAGPAFDPTQRLELK
jgi:hypothetical protein